MSSRPARLAALALAVVIGAALRLSELEQGLFGDELYSYVGATQSSLGGVLGYVGSDQEITPPLYTALAWLSGKIGEPEVLIRLPSLLAGVAIIPLAFLVGLRTVGRGAASIGAVLVALSPLLAFYAVEARAYSLAVALVTGATLSMLLALDRERLGWWVAYAALSAAAMYAHYTAAFVLAVQLGWLLHRHPEARRIALGANAAATLAFLPWVPSLLDDLDSPSQQAIADLAPFDPGNFTDFTGAFYLGHPGFTLNDFLGTPMEILFLAGLAVAVAGALMSRSGRGAPGSASRQTQASALVRSQGDVRGARGRDGRVGLVVMLALAAPVGAVLASLIGTDIYIPRNLATSWPPFALALGGLLTAGPRLPRAVATAAVLVAFAYGAWLTTEPEFGRPAIPDAAAFIDDVTGPNDVILDTGAIGALGPDGDAPQPPALTLDLYLDEPHRQVDLFSPPDARRALRLAAGKRLAIVGLPLFVDGARDGLGLRESPPLAAASFDGSVTTSVQVFSIQRPSP